MPVRRMSGDYRYMDEKGRAADDPRRGAMGRAFFGVGAVMPRPTPEQRLQNRRDARRLLPVLVGGTAAIAAGTFVASGSVLLSVLAAIVGYVVLTPVILIVLMRR